MGKSETFSVPERKELMINALKERLAMIMLEELLEEKPYFPHEDA